MLTVEDHGRIHRAHRDGMGIREIAQSCQHSRRRIRQVLEEPEPRPYTRPQEPWAPKLDALKPVIDAIRTPPRFE